MDHDGGTATTAQHQLRRDCPCRPNHTWSLVQFSGLRSIPRNAFGEFKHEQARTRCFIVAQLGCTVWPFSASRPRSVWNRYSSGATFGKTVIWSSSTAKWPRRKFLHVKSWTLFRLRGQPTSASSSTEPRQLSVFFTSRWGAGPESSRRPNDCTVLSVPKPSGRVLVLCV